MLQVHLIFSYLCSSCRPLIILSKKLSQLDSFALALLMVIKWYLGEILKVFQWYSFWNFYTVNMYNIV